MTLEMVLHLPQSRVTLQHAIKEDGEILLEYAFCTGRCYIFLNHSIPENCALLGYYIASSGNFLPTFRDTPSVPTSEIKNYFGFLNPEEGTDRLSRNVAKR